MLKSFTGLHKLICLSLSALQLLSGLTASCFYHADPVLNAILPAGPCPLPVLWHSPSLFAAQNSTGVPLTVRSHCKPKPSVLSATTVQSLTCPLGLHPLPAPQIACISSSASETRVELCPNANSSGKWISSIFWPGTSTKNCLFTIFGLSFFPFVGFLPKIFPC